MKMTKTYNKLKSNINKNQKLYKMNSTTKKI